MALKKRTYVSGQTIITAENLNEIQDSIITLEGKGLTKEEVVDALEYTPAKASDIPTTDISANTAARHSHSNKDVLDNITEITNISGGAVTGGANALVTKEVLDATSQLITDEIPSELKNPYALSFTGAATGSYDGSKPLTINIPSLTVDDTLTHSGQAADAKATGDAIRSLSEEIVTTSESKVAAHNTRTDTHSDIRLLIQGLTGRLNALADSDDTTLDQLSEVVAYIKSNRSLIDAITTSKVNVSDIVDNLTTNVSNKPLSAAQGVVIETLIDALHNDKLDASELTNAINNALAQAKASGDFDGTDGITPHIGENGNWYLGDEDTGKPSRGKAGPAGSDASVTAANIEAAMGYRPADPTKYLPLTGGKLTGNLEGKYITGTWLQSTAAGHQSAPATKVAVLDAQGWIYYRTPAELMADMGLADGTEVSY